MRNELMLAKMEHKLLKSEQENTKLRAENNLLRKGQESQEPQATARSGKKNASALQNETKAQRLFQGQNALKKLRKIQVLEQEKELGDGHLGPCGGNLPRPKERGGCDCEACTKNAAISEGAA